MYNVYYKILGETLLQGPKTHGGSQPLSLDAGVPALDVDKFYFIRESPAVKVYLPDVQGGRHGDGLRQELPLRVGNVSDVAQEEFHSGVQRGDLGERFPEVM